MSITRTLIIKSSDAAGTVYEKGVSNVNPEATNAQIDTFARSLQGLSTNGYVDTIKVEKESINEALAEAEGE